MKDLEYQKMIDNAITSKNRNKIEELTKQIDAALDNKDLTPWERFEQAHELSHALDLELGLIKPEKDLPANVLILDQNARKTKKIDRIYKNDAIVLKFVKN